MSLQDGQMEQTQPALQPTPVPVPPVAKGDRSTITILSLVIAGQTLAILLLAGALVFSVLMGFGADFGMPSAEMEEAMMAADDMAYEVGECLVDGDEQAYTDLYVSGDETVDMAEVRDEFAEVSAEATEGLEYGCDMYTLYEDSETGDRIVKAEVSGYDYNTGEPEGASITIYVNVDEMTLTGTEGRSLDMTDSF